ncbi:hypothetical protein GH714_031839 [Hevea brasiliensis]|uniref:Retrotransposon gag domain-containing protein n=1 Tax=Hevea brasiliensis TaxID=3981 RepID=A0A6A6NB87_HEVBR|nr:hypothetical protein GH714_031839 [Hevea brasiliensis]
MGDSIQQQLDRILALFLEEQAVNKARQEELNSKLEALTRDIAQSSQAHTNEGSSHTRAQRGKVTTTLAGSENSGASSVIPKFTKLDFPRFNGQDDPLGWLSRCEHFFRHQQTLEEEKVSLASFHLEGIAQLWFLQLMNDAPNQTWEEFKHQCILRFGPPIRSNKLGELAKLKQASSVADYQTKFEIQVSRAGTLTQDQKIQLYLSGLQEYIAVEVELHQPSDLVTAITQSLEISLNAITGIRNPQTMRLEGKWNGKQVLVLIDSGSTHSFVAAKLVTQADAQIDEKDGLRVKVANCEQLCSPGICRGVSLKLGSHPIKTDLFVLPLSSIGVVLGVNWLRTLGPILWDFSHQTVQAFNTLKTMMTNTPILALPDFDQPFVVECDAFDSGMGAVLLQNN